MSKCGLEFGLTYTTTFKGELIINYIKNNIYISSMELIYSIITSGYEQLTIGMEYT